MKPHEAAGILSRELSAHKLDVMRGAAIAKSLFLDQNEEMKKAGKTFAERKQIADQMEAVDRMLKWFTETTVNRDEVYAWSISHYNDPDVQHAANEEAHLNYFKYQLSNTN